MARSGHDHPAPEVASPGRLGRRVVAIWQVRAERPWPNPSTRTPRD